MASKAKSPGIVALAIAPLLILSGRAGADVVATWNVDGSGDWNVGSNWVDDMVPDGTDATADFGSAITAAHTVYTDSADTVSTINFNDTDTYVLAGTTSLTMQSSSDSAQINVGTSGGLVQTQEINLPLTIASNTVINVPTVGSELLVANPVTVNSGMSLTATGSGSVVYQSIVTLQSGASLVIPNSTFANTLSLASGSTVTVATSSVGSPNLLQLDNLSINSGTLNLSNNDLVVHGGSLSTITNEIALGRNSGTSPWAGTSGITSSAAAAAPSTMALGVAAATTTTFEGQPVSIGDILVKYTYVGDADLSGSINASDYAAIDNGFNMGLSGWSNGDFNYDGVVNGDDYTLIDNAYNTQDGVSIAGLSAGPTEQFASASTSAVPEPGSLTLLGIGSAAALSRRRRKV